MFKTIITATALSVAMIGAASAAPLGGLFSVEAANDTGLNSAQSQATLANFAAAQGSGSTDSFTYDGLLDFRVGGSPAALQSIEDWLGEGTGTVGGLDPAFGALQLSLGNINNGTAVSTFFEFTRVAPLIAGTLTITHDDGIAVFQNGSLIGSTVGPTSETTTVVDFGGGELSFLYVATNGNPSVFEVDFAPVPVPAALPLLLAGLGGLAFLRRRKTA